MLRTWFQLPLRKWDDLTVDQWSTMIVDIRDRKVIKVENVSNQVIYILLQPNVNSLLITASGSLQLQPHTTLEAEAERFDLEQLLGLQILRLITFDEFNHPVIV